jgi:hypothetical protein
MTDIGDADKLKWRTGNSGESLGVDEQDLGSHRGEGHGIAWYGILNR